MYFVNVGRTAAVNVTIPEKYKKKYRDIFSQWNEIRRELEANGGKTNCAESASRIMPHIDDLVVVYEDPDGKKYSTVLKEGKLIFN